MARFNSANARENAAKAHAARLQRLASEAQAAETFPHTSQGGPHDAANDYVLRRLARVRVQLDLVDKRITEQANDKTVDGQVLNWLCAAQERLAEQERVLAGRPLPGSRRPRNDEPRDAQPGAWMVAEPLGVAEPMAPAAPLPVEPPTPASTAPPIHRPTLPTGLVTIEEALRHRPAPLPTPASPAPPTTRTVLDVGRATMPSVPTVSPNPRPMG